MVTFSCVWPALPRRTQIAQTFPVVYFDYLWGGMRLKIVQKMIVKSIFCTKTLVISPKLLLFSIVLSSIQLGGIRTFLLPGVFLGLGVLRQFVLKNKTRKLLKFTKISNFINSLCIIFCVKMSNISNIYYSQKELDIFQICIFRQMSQKIRQEKKIELSEWLDTH